MYDVIISDYNMPPHINGIELVQEIRELFKNLEIVDPIYVLSTTDTYVSDEEEFRKVVDFFLYKPISHYNLTQFINNLNI